MAKRTFRKKYHPQVQRDWTYDDRLELDGKLVLTPGRVFRVKGNTRTYRFRQLVTSDGGTWVDAYDRDGTVRSFHPEAIRKVHRPALADKVEHQRRFKR